MAKHVKRSVIPIYLVGVVWLVFGLGLRLYQPVDYILCALVSVAAFVVGKAIFPDKSYQIAGGEDEEEKKQAEQEAQKRAEEAHAAREKAQAEREERQRREQEEKARQAQQAKSTGNPEIDKLILERERALSEMRRLNDSIEPQRQHRGRDHLRPDRPPGGGHPADHRPGDPGAQKAPPDPPVFELLPAHHLKNPQRL